MIYSRITLNAAVKVIREAADRSVCSVSGTRSNTRDLKLRTRKTSRTVRLIDGYHLEFTFQTNIHIYSSYFLTACIQDISGYMSIGVISPGSRSLWQILSPGFYSLHPALSSLF